MKLTRKALTTVALSGVMLAGTAVPAQAAIDQPTGGSRRTCQYGTLLIPQRVRIDTCSDGLTRVFVWNRKARPQTWRLVWQG